MVLWKFQRLDVVSFFSRTCSVHDNSLCHLRLFSGFGDSRPYRFSIQPLTILGVTGPFSVLAENIYSLCTRTFNVRMSNFDLTKVLNP